MFGHNCFSKSSSETSFFLLFLLTVATYSIPSRKVLAVGKSVNTNLTDEKKPTGVWAISLATTGSTSASGYW